MVIEKPAVLFWSAIFLHLGLNARHDAAAQSSWTCSYVSGTTALPFKFAVKGNVLEGQTPFLGNQAPQMKNEYKIILNDDLGIIASIGAAGSNSGGDFLWSEVVMIYKKSGQFRWATLDGNPKPADDSHFGTCVTP